MGTRNYTIETFIRSGYAEIMFDSRIPIEDLPHGIDPVKEFQDMTHELSSVTSERDSLRKRVEELERKLAKEGINTLVFEVSESSDGVVAWSPLNEHASTFLLDNESVEYLEFNAADFIGCRATVIFSTNQPAPHEGDEG